MTTAMLKDYWQRFWRSRFPMFLLVGMINTIFGYGLFSLFIYLGIRYQLAVLFSTILGILFNFKTTGRIVFKSHNNKLIFRFFAVYGILYLINLLLIKLIYLVYPDYYIAGAIAIVILPFLGFHLNKFLVFREAVYEKTH